MRTMAQRRRAKRSGFLVNGYPDGEYYVRHTAAWERWQRMRDRRLQRAQEEATMKLKDMEPIALLDCSHAARDLFNAVPRLAAADQAILIDYVEMLLAMWRAGRVSIKAPADGGSEG